MTCFFKMLLTGKDNQTYEIARVLLFVGFVSFLIFAAYDVLVSQHNFDPLSYSAGLTGMLFGGSSGIAIKAKTEPENKDDHP